MRRKKILDLDGDLSLRVVAGDEGVPTGYKIGREWIMNLMDMAVRLAAGARTRGPVRTASVLNIEFAQLPREGDVVCVYTNITRMGRTSITVGVVAYALRCFLEQRVRLTTADYVVVALDDCGIPRTLPSV